MEVTNLAVVIECLRQQLELFEDGQLDHAIIHGAIDLIESQSAENSSLRAAMHEIAPFKDCIICYASTCSEYEGNRVSKAFDDALAASTEQKQ